MSRRRRIITNEFPLEVIPRARDTLPLPPNSTTNAIRLGIFGRAQRDDKVTLCNLVCMNNHDHMHLLPQDPAKFCMFYGEVLKKTTDALRALTGERSLRIWEDRASVMVLGSLENVIERLVYIFCNPAKAGIADSIESYKGINSWEAFCTCEPSVDATYQLEVFWHPVKSLPLVGRKGLTEAEDFEHYQALKESKDAVKHTLVFAPFAWLKLFGITEPEEIEEIRRKVIRQVKEKEAEYRAERERKRRPVMSVRALTGAPYLKPHTPKKKERKIFLICSDKQKRQELIKYFDYIDERCAECYRLAKKGIRTAWPPGTFVPWLPPMECLTCE